MINLHKSVLLDSWIHIDREGRILCSLTDLSRFSFQPIQIIKIEETTMRDGIGRDRFTPSQESGPIKSSFPEFLDKDEG